MKRIITYILLAVLLLGTAVPVAYADEDETVESEAETLGGWLEDDFYWELEDGTLTITGEGSMPGEAPWREYANQIENLFLEDGIYSIAPGVFRDLHMLKEIQFSRDLVEIGDYAFQGCTALEEIRLPDTFRRFGASSFGGCTSLSQVYCDSYMPRFSEGCLWNGGGRIYIYYSPDRVWGVEDVKTLERNFGGRLEVLCQDGTDPIPNGEDEPQPLAPVTVTEPEPTEAPTVPPTEAPTVPTTVATEPPVVTVPETTVPETTVPETTLPQATQPLETLPAITEATEPIIEEETVRGGFIGLALVLGVVTFFIVGALIFKVRSRSGRY